MEYIITPQEIAKNTPLGGNVDVDKYAYMIPEQQVFVLEPTLGTALLDKILEDINTIGIDNLTGHYKKIVFDYCKPILWNSVFAEYALFGDVSIDNNGIFKVLPPDSETADESTITRIVESRRQKAQVYIDRLERYLCDKGNDIAEYKDNQPNDYDTDPLRSNNIVGGIYLKDVPRYKDWRVDEYK